MRKNFNGHIKTVQQRTIIQQYGDWYSGRWWVGCYSWYSEEGPGRAAAPPDLLLAVPNVTAHPSTAGVPTSYNSMWHYNCSLKGYVLPSKLDRNVVSCRWKVIGASTVWTDAGGVFHCSYMLMSIMLLNCWFFTFSQTKSSKCDEPVFWTIIITYWPQLRSPVIV